MRTISIFSMTMAWIIKFILHHLSRINITCAFLSQSGCWLSVTLPQPINFQSLAASENLGSWLAALAALWGNDFAGSVLARRHLTKLISDRILRQRDGLMIYNKIERVLVITKLIFNYYYNTNFSLEITSKVQKVNQKYTFTHKLTTKRNFRMPSLFF